MRFVICTVCIEAILSQSKMFIFICSFLVIVKHFVYLGGIQK